MRFCAARLVAVALTAIAVTDVGCRRAPFTGPSGDAGGETMGVPSVGDAARDAPMHQSSTIDGRDDLTTADAPSAVTLDATAEPAVDVAGDDARANDDASSDRVLADSSDARPEDQPCGSLGFICAPFACDVARSVCKTNCVTNADCATGKMCDGVGLCGFREATACTSDDECLSGHCAQGVCCSTACAGPCRSCALPSSVGTCALVGRGAFDPSGVCAAGATCNGRGGCVPATCAADTDCGDLYMCNDARCAPCNATCTSTAACLAPAVCIMRNFCTYCGIPDGGTGL